MTVFVLDSSAVLRHIDNETGAERVQAILQSCLRGGCEIQISAVQWGEIAGKLQKRFGHQEERKILRWLLEIDLNVVSATADRAAHAAEIKVERKLSYADAFAVELAMDSADHILVTSDYNFKAVADLARIEFLPAK
jgi:predicted nucleic acid-binding protein